MSTLDALRRMIRMRVAVTGVPPANIAVGRETMDALRAEVEQIGPMVKEGFCLDGVEIILDTRLDASYVGTFQGIPIYADAEMSGGNL